MTGTTKFKVGDIVKIRECWKDEMEKGNNFKYIVEEWYGDRGFIRCMDVAKDWIIRPTELVRPEMIELI